MQMGITYELNTKVKIHYTCYEKERWDYGWLYHKAHKMYHINYCDITYCHSNSFTDGRQRL